jgi:hypothetical protein
LIEASRFEIFETSEALREPWCKKREVVRLISKMARDPHDREAGGQTAVAKFSVQ